MPIIDKHWILCAHRWKKIYHFTQSGQATPDVESECRRCLHKVNGEKEEFDPEPRVVIGIMEKIGDQNERNYPVKQA